MAPEKAGFRPRLVPERRFVIVAVIVHSVPYVADSVNQRTGGIPLDVWVIPEDTEGSVA
jgi:hypothetical protein